MAEKKETLEKNIQDHLEKDPLKKLDVKEKIAALRNEIEYLHFLPSTNIILDPKRNCGNLHKHLFILATKITNKMLKTMEDSPLNIILLQAAPLLVTGIANCGGLSAYAFYRWFISTEFNSINDLPILIFFTAKNKELTDNQDHCALGVGVQFDEALFKQTKEISVLRTDDTIILDFWLNIIGQKKTVLKTIYERSATYKSEFRIFFDDCRNMEDFKRCQVNIKSKFKLICEEFNRLFQNELLRYPFFESSNISSLFFNRGNQNYYQLNYSNFNKQIVFPIDVQAAHEDLRKSFEARQGTKHQHDTLVRSNITRLWEYLIKNVSSNALSIFKKDPKPLIQEMVVKHRSNVCQQLFMIFRKCCRPRPNTKSDAPSIMRGKNPSITKTHN